MGSPPRRLDLLNSYDVIFARQYARQMARELGFGLTDQTRIATAVSEVGRLALNNDGKGEIRFSSIVVGVRQGLECTCLVGKWPDAPLDPSREWVFGGVRRLMDEIEIEPREDEEVTVVMRKWMR